MAIVPSPRRHDIARSVGKAGSRPLAQTRALSNQRDSPVTVVHRTAVVGSTGWPEWPCSRFSLSIRTGSHPTVPCFFLALAVDRLGEGAGRRRCPRLQRCADAYRCRAGGHRERHRRGAGILEAARVRPGTTVPGRPTSSWPRRCAAPPGICPVRLSLLSSRGPWSGKGQERARRAPGEA